MDRIKGPADHPCILITADRTEDDRRTALLRIGRESRHEAAFRRIVQRSTDHSVRSSPTTLPRISRSPGPTRTRFKLRRSFFAVFSALIYDASLIPKFSASDCRTAEDPRRKSLAEEPCRKSWLRNESCRAVWFGEWLREIAFLPFLLTIIGPLFGFCHSRTCVQVAGRKVTPRWSACAMDLNAVHDRWKSAIASMRIELVSPEKNLPLITKCLNLHFSTTPFGPSH